MHKKDSINLLDITDELLFKIINTLEFSDLRSLNVVSSVLRALSLNENVWKTMFGYYTLRVLKII